MICYHFCSKKSLLQIKKDGFLTEEGYCCQGNCIEKRESSSWLYGLIIIVIVVVGLILFSLYMKKRQKPIDILKERQEKYEKRMKGEEVRGGLTKT